MLVACVRLRPLALAAALAGPALGCSYDWAGALVCANAVLDSGESDVDCGGICGPCAFGQTCRDDADCAIGGVCAQGRCAPAETSMAWALVKTTGGAPSRFGASFAYLGASRDQTLRFAGYVYDQSFDDTWVLSQDAWTNATMGPASTPPKRHYAPMVYDAKNDRALVVGGYAGGLVDDAWWYEDGWTPAPAPMSARLGMGMAYAPTTEEIILFGGNETATDTTAFDTSANAWETVTLAAASEVPPPRVYCAMAYDPDGERIVLFGGDGEAGLLGDTWEYQPVRRVWRRIESSDAPSKREAAGMTYDEQRRRIVLHGGAGPGTEPLDDTWELDGDTWLRVDVAPPASGGRFHAGFVHETARGRTLLLGGTQSKGAKSPLGDVWAYVSVGSLCSAPSDCASGYCVDGLCCHEAQCPDGQTCNTASAPGTCAAP